MMRTRGDGAGGPASEGSGDLPVSVGAGREFEGENAAEQWAAAGKHVPVDIEKNDRGGSAERARDMSSITIKVRVALSPRMVSL